jgi:ADP-heptose:LPS heptosyltransferase
MIYTVMVYWRATDQRGRKVRHRARVVLVASNEEEARERAEAAVKKHPNFIELTETSFVATPTDMVIDWVA